MPNEAQCSNYVFFFTGNSLFLEPRNHYVAHHLTSGLRLKFNRIEELRARSPAG